MDKNGSEYDSVRLKNVRVIITRIFTFVFKNGLLIMAQKVIVRIAKKKSSKDNDLLFDASLLEELTLNYIFKGNGFLLSN